ncbi:hypothetical protein Tco_1243393 [Tanacetum coccineum]
MLDVQVQHEDPSIHSSSLLIVQVLVIPEPITLSSIPKTVTAAPVTPIPPPIPSFIPYSQQSTPILTPIITDVTTSTHELKHVDHSTTLLATIKSEVLTAVKEYLGTSLDDALHKILHRHNAEFIKEHFVLPDVIEVLKQQRKPQENKGVADKLKKRKPDDADRDEDPPAGSDQGLKRRETSKDVEPSKKVKSNDTSKGTTKSQLKSTSKSAQAEETVFKAGDTQVS